jgi:DNA modification methylase
VSVETFHDGRVVLHGGDCLDILATLPADSVDAVVTDPPYHLASIVKRFGKDGAAPASGNGATGVYKRASRGFMGKTWDGGEIAHDPATWAAVLRVLKPGGHVVAFHASKNWARQAVAMEDAGFEMRDTITDLFDAGGRAEAFLASLDPTQAELFAHLLQSHDGLSDLFWIYGTGFPKSLDVSKAIDKRLGAEREVVGTVKRRDIRNGHGRSHGSGIHSADRDGGATYLDHAITQPGSEEAARWKGWGTALKPAFEPICLGRKPIAASAVDLQVMATGTGAINVDACRIEAGAGEDCRRNSAGGDNGMPGSPTFRIRERRADDKPAGLGRFPANVTHDGSALVEGVFPDVGLSTGGQASLGAFRNGDVFGKGRDERKSVDPGYGDSGSAARFFYSAKADADDRLGSKHPTVKPIDLMRWLVRLVTPPGGTILDPFAGTGTTGEAALLEGFNAVLIEREPEYRADIARRMGLVFEGEVARTKAKAMRATAAEPLPLFDIPAEGGAGASTAPSPTRPLDRADRAEAVI